MVWKQREVLEMVKSSLQNRFEMKDLGTSIFLLGIELRRHGGGVSLACAVEVCFKGVEVWHGGQQGSFNTFRTKESLEGRDVSTH